MRPVHIVVLAKAPVSGQVKTRLIPALGAQGAADLARDMLYNTLGHALAAGVGPVELCASPPEHDPAWQAIVLPATVSWSDQGAGDLGARMARAAQRIIATRSAILLIGTDCPKLDATAIRHAASVLAQYDAVMAPSFDGGYTLLGLNQFDPSIFTDIAWSTAEVASITRQRLTQLGWRTYSLPMMHDIDIPDDLQWLDTPPDK
ncbi:TIGR04282 family arsenosugar biosynthesis glycosyltransferase [Alcaligenaceae bacterium CGII-47]|nr:TIGR04282 family arsenosugar biosynthesis glycosyltransferase [Alcaligenaceae bacterium CGII-47]